MDNSERQHLIDELSDALRVDRGTHGMVELIHLACNELNRYHLKERDDNLDHLESCARTS